MLAILLFLICKILSSVSASPTPLRSSDDPADVLDSRFEGATLALRATEEVSVANIVAKDVKLEDNDGTVASEIDLRSGQNPGSWPPAPSVYLNCSKPLVKGVPLRHCAPSGPGQPDDWPRNAITSEWCSSHCRCERVLSAVVFFCPEIGNCSDGVSETTCRNAGHCDCCSKNSTATECSAFQGNVYRRSDNEVRSNDLYTPAILVVEEHKEIKEPIIEEREPIVDTSDVVGYDHSTFVNRSLIITCKTHGPNDTSVLRSCPAGRLTRAECIDKCYCSRLKPQKETLFPIVICPAVLGCNGPDAMEACNEDGHCRCHFRDSTLQTREIDEPVSLEDASIAEQLDTRANDPIFGYSLRCDATAKHPANKIRHCGQKKVLERTTCQANCHCTDKGVVECPKFDKCNATAVTKVCDGPGGCKCFPLHEPPPPGVAGRAMLDAAEDF